MLAHRAPVGRRLVALRCVCVLGALGSVAVGWLLSASATDPNRLYFGTDTRAVALLTGCALAAFLTDRPAVSVRHSRTLAAAALGGTLVVAWLWTHADGTGTALYRGPLLLSALAMAAVLAHTVLVPTSVTAGSWPRRRCRRSVGSPTACTSGTGRCSNGWTPPPPD